jgi:hypothetical protein
MRLIIILLGLSLILCLIGTRVELFSSASPQDVSIAHDFLTQKVHAK